MTDHDRDVVVERFRPTNGRFSGILGLLAAAVVLVLAIAAWDPGTPLGVAIAACLGGLVVWAVLLRPSVSVTERELVMRNMLHTDRIPLPAIQRVAVGQVLAIGAGGKRYVSPVIGNSARQTIQNKRTGETPTAVDSYPVYVEERITHLAKESRDRLGVAAGSAEQEALARGVRRTYAWPEIAGIAVTVAAFVVWLLN